MQVDEFGDNVNHKLKSQMTNIPQWSFAVNSEVVSKCTVCTQ